MRIASTDLNFEREPLSTPFGFKGGYLSELWQTAAMVQLESGSRGVGLGVQSVLWSDTSVFSAHPEAAGNALMFAVSAYALSLLPGREMTDPIALQDEILPEVIQYARHVTGKHDLRTTFVLNALVPVDNALWLAWAQEHGLNTFDSILPTPYSHGLSHRNNRVISIPAVGYGMSLAQIGQLIDAGHYVLKIKIGSDPERDGDLDKMLAWDCYRLHEIHRTVGYRFSGPGENKKILYYLDANQRYDSIERINSLLDFMEQHGILERTILLEEPFAEENLGEVGSLPVHVVADESAHTEADAIHRMQLGYRAIALKPVAKTLSMTLKIAQAAFERDVACFCADLTVNPVLVDWNKSVAARLRPVPGLAGGALETNGAQNYKNWKLMQEYHPCHGASWTREDRGEFILDHSFFEKGGGMFEASSHYSALLGQNR
jgi:L-alanine-DL-glutamate epimerase-like enolase superfamily enzyme